MRKGKKSRKKLDPRMKKYRGFLLLLLFINIIGIGAYSYHLLEENIPDKIRILVDKVQNFNFGLPLEADFVEGDLKVLQVNESNVPEGQLHLDLNQPFSVQSTKTGSYQIILKLFGWLELKKVSLDVIESLELIPCGDPIGITLHTDGILVLGTGTVTGEDGMNYEPALNILKSGDYIEYMNGRKIATKEQLIAELQNLQNETVTIGIRRDNEIIEVRLKPVRTVNGEYKIGAWIRDDTQGIGTLTFVTTTGEFGALGHGITDVDTGVLMKVGKGAVYNAEIVSIVKGKSGTPGELSGIIRQSDGQKIGDLIKNTNQGIFGTLGSSSCFWKREKEGYNNTPVEIGLRQEIKTGPATILCHVDGKIKEYDIEIEEMDLSNKSYNKGLVIHITDPELISLTGGIVQGMSGSPIIQNEKIIGAVTHVFVRDATRGYGTFIENMIHVLQQDD